MASDRRLNEGQIRSELPPLARAILWRRSFRAYQAASIDERDLNAIAEAAQIVPTVEGRRSGRVQLIGDPDQVSGLIRSITSGLVGKTNWWLKGANVSAILVCAADRSVSPVHRGRWFYNIDVALAGQAAVLAAAERMVGSCWMAAIGEPAVLRFLGLEDPYRVVAAIPLGIPRQRAVTNFSGLWDRMARRLVSSRRKSINAIHAVDHPESSQRLPAVDLNELKGAGLSVLELLRRTRPTPHPGPTPPDDQTLAWMAEACRQAPTADNSQIWRLLFIRNPGRIAAILDAATHSDSTLRDTMADLVSHPPGALVVLSSAPFAIRHRTREQPFYLLDVPIGILHMVLMAEHMGLRWNVLVKFDYEEVRAATGLPQSHRIVAIIMLGNDPKNSNGPMQIR